MSLDRKRRSHRAGRKERHALICGLLADLAGFVAAVLVCYLFFA